MSDNVFNSFTTAPTQVGAKEFLETNSIVAKFAFLLLAIFLFLVALRLGISGLSYFLKPSSPKLINGMIDAKQAMIFNQDPSGSPYTPVPLSDNQSEGIEFTWSCWIYINDLKYLEGQYRHVFYKGNSTINSNGLNEPNNAPGLYIAPHTNALVVMMNTFSEINKELVIPDIPIGKWINVIIRCQNKTLDVYINGTITRSINLMGVPKQNTGDVFVCSNGGYDGYLSNLWYYNYGLSVSEIAGIVNRGPNTSMVGSGSNALNEKSADYLSLRWYIRGG